MPLKFGTDGIRGVANSELTPEFATALGLAAARVLAKPGQSFFVGRDTRLSGPMLQSALCAGLASGGVNPIDLGVAPTPAVAYMCASQNIAGAVISASHNAFQDNGIKFFTAGGNKLPDGIEGEIEASMSKAVTDRPSGDSVGSITAGSADSYQKHLVDSIADADVAGLTVVIDCANGAASEIAPTLFRSLGVKVVVLSDSPDGRNINADCGSTHPASMLEAVAANHADMGFAFDGDADRVLAADHTGSLIDGDHLLGLLAIAAKRAGALKDNTLVTTVMANLGLRIAMESEGISVYETKVGDRYVLEALGDNAWSLGGEQSGHIIFPSLATTGDGMLTAVQVMAEVVRSGKSLNVLASVVTKLPQVLRNVRVKDKDALEGATAVWSAVEQTQQQLGSGGRVLLRTSGTEPLVRVMVEAGTQSEADAICERLCSVVESELA